MNLRSVKTSTLQEIVFHELFKAIVTGDFMPGQRLTIRDLAERLEVSVMPVREALRRLEATGCISTENRKFVVNELSLSNMDEIYEARIMLESHLAAAACQNRTPANLKELEKLHKQFVKAESGDPFLERNKAFHFEIYELAQKPIILNIISNLWDRLSPYLYILSRNIENLMSEQIVQHHSGMIESLEKRDEDAIRQWIVNDLTVSATRIKRVITDELLSKNQ